MKKKIKEIIIILIFCAGAAAAILGLIMGYIQRVPAR